MMDPDERPLDVKQPEVQMMDPDERPLDVRPTPQGQEEAGDFDQYNATPMAMQERLPRTPPKAKREARAENTLAP